jgi:hypothetical protein
MASKTKTISKAKARKAKASGERKLETYTVIGMFGWGQRHHEVIQAETAAQAEQLFSDEADCIAGVIAGAQEVDPEWVHKKPIEYTVIAYYEDNAQRYGAAVQACSVAEAEDAAIRVCNEDNGYGMVDPWGDEQEYDPDIIVICGTVEGNHDCADIYSGGEGSAFERATAEDVTYELWRREQEGR